MTAIAQPGSEDESALLLLLLFPLLPPLLLPSFGELLVEPLPGGAVSTCVQLTQKVYFI